MADDTLKSFFVSLAARIDQASFAKFNDTIGRTTKSAVALGAAVEAAFLSVNVWAAKVSSGFDQLYFSSQRIGASAGNIKALTYGLSQVGTTAGAASASFENFARTLRNNRGYYSVLERLGINTKNADGTRRAADALFTEYGKALRGKSSELKHLYLEMFGIDENTGAGLIAGIDRFVNEYNQRLRKAGLDPDKAARDGNALQTTFRQIGSSIEIIGAKVASKLFEGQNNGLQRFLDFLDQNGNKIADVIALLAKVALELAMALLKLATSEGVTKALNAMLGAFGNLDEKTGEFTADLDKLKVALGVFATFVAGSWVMKVLGAFGLLGKGWGSLLRTLGLPAAIGMAASGGGHETPEQYRQRVESDPASRQFEKDRIQQRDKVRGYFGDVFRPKAGDSRSFWERVAPKAFGGKDAPATSPSPSASGSTGEGAATPEQSAALGDAIARAEGTYRNGYDTLLGHGKWGTPSKPISQMTMDEVYEFGLQMRRAQFATGKYARFSDTSSALGRYQIVGSTMRDAMKALGLKGDDLFNAENQERMMRWIARKQGLGAWEGLKINRRAMAAAQAAMDAGGARDETAEQAAARRRPKLTPDDILPGGLPGSTNGGLPSFRAPPQPAPAINQRTSSIIIHQGPISVQGMNDGKQVADRIDRVQGYRTSDLARNMRSSVG